MAQNGILLIGGAALLVLLLAPGCVELLVVLYRINGFITGSLSQLGVVQHWWLHRATERGWVRKLSINGLGLVRTSGISISLCVVKFLEGGWITFLVTGLLIAGTFWIDRHYRQTREQLGRLDVLMEGRGVAKLAPRRRSPPEAAPQATDPQTRTTIVLASDFNGLGGHALPSVVRMLPNLYRNFVFAQVGVVDAGSFKGAAEVENLRRHAATEVERYATYRRGHDISSTGCFAIGKNVVEEATRLCEDSPRRFPNSQVIAGQSIFNDDSFLRRLLHNYTVFAMQRRFYCEGRAMLILPIRV